MSTEFPNGLDNFINPTEQNTLNDADPRLKHTEQHTNANDAIEALQRKVGVDNSQDSESIDYILKSGSSIDPGHKHSDLGKVKISGSDSDADYLINKIKSGVGVTIGQVTEGEDYITINTTLTQYTDIMAKNAVGGSLLDTSTIDFSYDNILKRITANVIPSGISHSSISDLDADDHEQYFNQERGDARYYTQSQIDTSFSNLNTGLSSLGTSLTAHSSAANPHSGSQAKSANLTALSAYNTNGILTQTAANTFVGRTLVQGTGITITNANGVAGNPTISVDQTQITHSNLLGLAADDHTQYFNQARGDSRYYTKTQIDETVSGLNTAISTQGSGLTNQINNHINAVNPHSGVLQPYDETLTALAAYSTNGFLVRTAQDTFVGRSLVQGTGITITNASGVTGNPSITVNQSQIDHGSIGGLSDDDHTQYFNQTRGDVRYYTKNQVDTMFTMVAQNIEPGQIDHNNLANIGVNTHADIDLKIIALDNHIAAANPHAGSQPLDATLTALAAYNTNGILVQTAADTFIGRSLTQGTGITIANANGVLGNPTISVNQSQIDHGSIGGLSDDDHTIYVKADGTRVFTGDVNMGGKKITALGTPTGLTDAVNKSYVDSVVNGLDWQDSVKSRVTTNPTVGLTAGDRYIVATPAINGFTAHGNQIAEWNGIVWLFTTPNEGYAVWVEDEDNLYTYNGASWVKFGSTMTHANLLGLDADDHTQYLNTTRGDARYYTKNYIDTNYYTITDIDDAFTGFNDLFNTSTGHSHDGVNSKKVSHTDLLNIGVNTHAQIDTKITALDSHIAASNPHSGSQPLDATLTALAAFNSNGILVQTAADTFTARTLAAGSTKITLSNANGVGGNPTIDVDQTKLDHGSIGGLVDDDHTQYVLKTGRSGGQTIYGGTLAYNTLTLDSTSNASKGYVLLKSATGIGIDAPLTKFHVSSAEMSSNIRSQYMGNAIFSGTDTQNAGLSVVGASDLPTGDRPIVGAVRAGGTLAAPTTVANGYDMFSFLTAGYDGTQLVYPAMIHFKVDNTVSVGNIPTKIEILTGTNAGNRLARITATSDGKVGINNGSPSYPLDVTGNARFANDIYGTKISTVSGNLKLDANSKAITMFEDVVIADDASGGSFTLYRKANEGTSTFTLQLDPNGAGLFSTSGSQVISAGTGLSNLFIYANNIGFNQWGSASNATFEHWGKIAAGAGFGSGAAGDRFNITWKIDDNDDYFTLSRNNSQYLKGFKVKMPLTISGALDEPQLVVYAAADNQSSADIVQVFNQDWTKVFNIDWIGNAQLYGTMSAASFIATDNGSAPIVTNSTSVCANLNADFLDDYNASDFGFVGSNNEWWGENVFSNYTKINNSLLESVFNAGGTTQQSAILLSNNTGNTGIQQPPTLDFLGQGKLTSAGATVPMKVAISPLPRDDGAVNFRVRYQINNGAWGDILSISSSGNWFLPYKYYGANAENVTAGINLNSETSVVTASQDCFSPSIHLEGWGYTPGGNKRTVWDILSAPEAGTTNSIGALRFIYGVNTGSSAVANEALRMQCGDDSSSVFNYNKLDRDFRIAGTTETNLFFVDAGNNRVAVGSSSPDSLVHLVGTTTGDGGTNNGSGSVLHIKQSTPWGVGQPWALFVEGTSYMNGFRINGSDGQRSLHKVSAGGLLGFSTQGDDPITFTQSVSSERMRIHSGGNVGINQASPVAKLHITGNSDIIQFILDTHSTQASNYNVFKIRNSLGSDLLMFDANGGAVFNEQGTAANFRIESDNNQYQFYVSGGSDSVFIGDGGNSNYRKFDVNGTMTMEGLAQPMAETTFIMGSEGFGVRTPATGGAQMGTIDAGNGEIGSCDFDKDNAESVDLSFKMPGNYEANTAVVVELISTCSLGGNVMWQVQYSAISDGDLMSEALSTSVQGTFTLVANKRNTHAISLTSVAINPEDYMIFRITRVADNAADTLAEDAKLLMANIQYKVNS